MNFNCLRVHLWYHQRHIFVQPKERGIIYQKTIGSQASFFKLAADGAPGRKQGNLRIFK